MKRKSGFTLVELLVVIGIIAVLISILLPALNRARQASNSVHCMSTLKQFGTAIQMYAGANKGSLPLAYWDGTATSTNAADKSGATDWAWLILPYLRKGSTGTYNGADPGKMWELFKDLDTLTGSQSADNNAQHVQTYGVNQVLFGYSPGPLTADAYAGKTGSPGPGDDGKRPFKMNQIKRAAEIFLIMDASQIGNQGGGAYGNDVWASDADLTFLQGQNYDCRMLNLSQMVAKYPQGVDAGLNKDYAKYFNMQIDSGPNNAKGNDMRFRHIKNTTANVLFGDGHVGSFHFNRPGVGGSDITWANLVPEDLHYRVP